MVCCAGGARWGPVANLTDDDFGFSLPYNLMGQVSVVRVAKDLVKDGGSITVTSGILANNPIPGSAAVSLVNAGLEAFVRAAGLEMPRGVRVNVVSAPWVKETLQGRKMESHSLAAADVAKAYVAAVEGQATERCWKPRASPDTRGVLRLRPPSTSSESPAAQVLLWGPRFCAELTYYKRGTCKTKGGRG